MYNKLPARPIYLRRFVFRCSWRKSAANVQLRQFSNNNDKLSEFISVFKDNLKEEMMGQKLNQIPSANPEHEDKNLASRFLHQLKENFEDDLKEELKNKLPKGSPFGSGGFGGLPRKFLKGFLENCHKSHALQIARQEGINLRSINFDTSDANSPKALIDAPGASEDEIKRLGARVRDECPMTGLNRAAGGKDVEFVKTPVRR